MGNRTAPKEGSHLWIMANMLATLRDDPEQLLLHFLKYAIAACHPKIKRRIKSISSKTHWKCFQSITPDDIQVQASSPRPRQSLEFKNDHNFLCTLAKREIVPDYEACYPNIAAVLPHWTTASAASPPTSARMTDSVTSWRISRAREIPNASRTATSRRRLNARTSRRLATFAHAISSTSSETAPSRAATRRSPEIWR